MKDKKGASITNAFNNIVINDKRKPEYVWVDKGSEFYNKTFKEWLKQNDINMYSTFNEGKAVVIERFNRTLKNKMYKQFTIQGNTQYLEILPKIVKEYNNTKHSSIKMTPTEASKKKNEGTVYFNLYGDMEPLSAKPKFKVGDKVRISKYKRIVFDKGYTPNWSEEMFVITKIQHTNPITYKIKDLNDEEIKERSCTTLLNNQPSTPSGNYTIDPDGPGRNPPFSVYCDMSSGVGVTVISHDSESRSAVVGYNNIGSYRRVINYAASIDQLSRLADISVECEQFLGYECLHSRVWRSDQGLLTWKPDLPVKELRFGDTQESNSEMGYHTLGKLKCSGLQDDKAKLKCSPFLRIDDFDSDCPLSSYCVCGSWLPRSCRLKETQGK
ncbi:hypothetical protein ACROYT_G020374 [Oculina patagonica]